MKHARAEEFAMPSSEELGQLSACAEDAQKLVDLSWRLLSKLTYKQSLRTYTALPLLLSCLDRTWSFYELAGKPKGFQGAAVLYRPVIESFLRGAFLAGPACDDEILYFRKNDELKKRTRMRPKPERPEEKVKMGALELVEVVEHWFGPAWGLKLSETIKSDWNDWHGIVHGGRLVVAMYRGGPDSQGKVGAVPMQQTPPAKGMINVIVQVACFACLIPLAAGPLVNDDPDEEILALVAAGRIANDAFFARWKSESDVDWNPTETPGS